MLQTSRHSECGPEPPLEEQEFIHHQSLWESISHISSVTSRTQNKQLRSGKDKEDSNSAVRKLGLLDIHRTLHSTETTDKHVYFSSSMNIYEH